MKIITIIILLLFLSSCNPDRFIINTKSQNTIFGKILDGLDSFEQINYNTFILSEGRVAIRTYLQTQNDISFNYDLISGDTIIFVLRTVEKKYDNENGIKIIIDKNSTKIFENKKLINEIKEIITKNNQTRYINIRNIGNIIHFTQDCEKFTVKSNIPATDYLFIQSLKNSKILISGLEYEQIIENYSKKIYY